MKFKGAFLKKFIPVTPKEKRHCQNFSYLDKPLLDSSSPCPSPTPIFQQLYQAVAYWERFLSDSPEKLRRKLSLDLGTKFGSSLDEPDETDDEHSIDTSPNVENMKKRHSVYFSEITETKKFGERRKSSPAELTLSEVKNKKQNFIKIRIIDDNS